MLSQVGLVGQMGAQAPGDVDGLGLITVDAGQDQSGTVAAAEGGQLDRAALQGSTDATDLNARIRHQ
jgi:hypothetical protein